MSQKLNLAFSFDRGYARHFYGLFQSILDYHSPQEIYLHIIPFELSENELHDLKKYISSVGCDVTFYSIDHNEIRRFEATITGTWSIAVYLKIFFPVLVSKDVSQLLYIDVDTVVTGSLKPLFKIDLGDCPLGAVYDCYVGKRPDLGIDSEGDYFNSGVMIFNVAKWKELNITGKAIEFASKHPEKIKFVDQDALNAALVNMWLKLDKRYNLLFSYINPDSNSKEYERIKGETVIIHFTLEKPWHLLCQNRFRKLYKKYGKKASFSNKSLVVDFSINKIPAFLRLRIREWYLDSIIVKKIWKAIRASFE
ncbi:MAG: glycosyltransferase family 8 protein [Bacteroidota bacterium]